MGCASTTSIQNHKLEKFSCGSLQAGPVTAISQGCSVVPHSSGNLESIVDLTKLNDTITQPTNKSFYWSYGPRYMVLMGFLIYCYMEAR